MVATEFKQIPTGTTWNHLEPLGKTVRTGNISFMVKNHLILSYDVENKLVYHVEFNHLK